MLAEVEINKGISISFPGVSLSFLQAHGRRNKVSPAAEGTHSQSPTEEPRTPPGEAERRAALGPLPPSASRDGNEHAFSFQTTLPVQPAPSTPVTFLPQSVQVHTDAGAPQPQFGRARVRGAGVPGRGAHVVSGRRTCSSDPRRREGSAAPRGRGDRGGTGRAGEGRGGPRRSGTRRGAA